MEHHDSAWTTGSSARVSTFTLSVIQETFRDIGKATIFSTFDLKVEYWQISLHPDSQHVTAFITPYEGAFEFWVMLFGLKNAPASDVPKGDDRWILP